MGIPTASNFHLFMTPGGKPTQPDNKERRQYMYRLVAERILQEPMPPRFKGNEHTEHGQEFEDEAAQQFTARIRAELAPGGFVTTDDGHYGCSPDRLLKGLNAAIEIKAPAAWTHVGYMIDGPGDRYRAQVQGQIMIGEFQAVHFWSYHPRFAPVHIISGPDERYIARLRNELDLFFEEMLGVEDWVRRKGNIAEVVKEANYER